MQRIRNAAYMSAVCDEKLFRLRTVFIECACVVLCSTRRECKRSIASGQCKIKGKLYILLCIITSTIWRIAYTNVRCAESNIIKKNSNKKKQTSKHQQKVMKNRVKIRRQKNVCS